MAPWRRRGIIKFGLPTVTTEIVQKGLANDFRTWHWMHRLVQASKNDDMVRVSYSWALRRLHDLMMVKVPNLTYGPRPAQLLDLATSEKTAFLLFRVHVNHPVSITKKTSKVGVHATPMVTRALAAAKVPADVQTWTAANHQTFRSELVTACRPAPPPPGKKKNLDEVQIDLKLQTAQEGLIPGLKRRLKDGVGTFSLP
jgi:phage-related holin